MNIRRNRAAPCWSLRGSKATVAIPRLEEQLLVETTFPPYLGDCHNQLEFSLLHPTFKGQFMVPEDAGLGEAFRQPSGPDVSVEDPLIVAQGLAGKEQQLTDAAVLQVQLQHLADPGNLIIDCIAVDEHLQNGCQRKSAEPIC